MNISPRKLLILSFSLATIVSAAQSAVSLWTGNHRFSGWNKSIFYQKLNHSFKDGDKLIFSFSDVSGNAQIQIAANDNNTETDKSKFTFLPQDQGNGDYSDIANKSEWSYTLTSTMARLLADGANYLLIDGHEFTLTEIKVVPYKEPDPINPGDVTYKQGVHFFKPGTFPISFSPAHEFAADWSNKIVLHPEAFPEFDLQNHTYTIKISGNGTIQSGNAIWNADGEETDGSFILINDNTSSELQLTKTIVNRLKSGYCLQFNSGGGSVSLIELNITDGGNAEPDYSTKGFHTDGTRLLDANDNEFIMRGINYSWAWQTGDTWKIKSSKDWGFNTIRIQIGSGAKWNRPDRNTLESLINECEKNKLIAVFNVQDYTDSSEITDLEKAAAYWCDPSIVELLNEHIATVIVNINNEWPAETNQELWREGYLKVIPLLRDAGIKNTIMVDCGGWGQDAACLPKYGAEVAAADVMNNIMFSMHMYQISGREQDVIKHMSEGLTPNCPLVFGELAFEHKTQLGYPDGGPVAWKDILDYSYHRNLSWIGWSWNGNGGGAESCDMINSDGSLYENGKCLIYGPWGIKMTSTQCTVYDTAPEKGQPYRYPDPSTYADVTFSPFPYYGEDNTDPLPTRAEGTEQLPYVLDKWYNSEIFIKPEYFSTLGTGSKLKITLDNVSEGSQIQCYCPTTGNPDLWNTIYEKYDGMSSGTVEIDLYPGQARAAAAGSDSQPLSSQLGQNGLYIKGSSVTVSNLELDPGNLTGVDNVTIDNASDTHDEIYTITGIRVYDMQPGQVYVIRRGDKVYKLKR